MNRRKFILTGSILVSLPFLFEIVGCKNETVNEKKRKSTENNPKIEKLNLALEHEFGAIIQYCNHAGITDNIFFKKAIPEIVAQEVQHAILISNIIKNLGYNPTLSLWPPQTGKSFSDMIIKDMKTEKNAIELYESLLHFNFGSETKKIITNIIEHEKAHLKIFKSLKHNT